MALVQSERTKEKGHWNTMQRGWPTSCFALTKCRLANLVLRSLLREDIDSAGKLEIRATLVSLGRQDNAVERIVNRLRLEPSVSAVSWEVTGQSADAE
jgi:hypothetical protein